YLSRQIGGSFQCNRYFDRLVSRDRALFDCAGHGSSLAALQCNSSFYRHLPNLLDDYADYVAQSVRIITWASRKTTELMYALQIIRNSFAESIGICPRLLVTSY